jgi:methenyltetrahydromethanopterin cyclohydrolase
MDKMKWPAVAMAIGSFMACGRGSSPTAPTLAATPANIAGYYDASIGVSSTCSANLPAETRVLHYVANIIQTGAAVQLQLLAEVIWNTVTVTGTVSGQTVNFSSFSFSEISTAGGIALVATGTANIAPDGSITGTLSGTYQTPSGANCNAANHPFHLAKRQA